MPKLASVSARRYVQPLREGGSLPAVVDTDDGLYVVKFRGAGQGAKALIAELISGQLATAMGLPVPELAVVELPEPFGRSEPDPEIQDVLRASHGVNVGLRYLDGAFNFARAAAGELVDAAFASKLVWFDALVTNPDRTARNTNILVWRRQLWLIDHGASLYVHHDWERYTPEHARSAFPHIRDHVLLADASELEQVDAEFCARFDREMLRAVLDSIPDELLVDRAPGSGPDDAGAARERYLAYLLDRLKSPRAYVREAIDARARLLSATPQHLSARR